VSERDIEEEKFEEEIGALVSKIEDLIAEECLKIAKKYNKPYEEALELYSEIERLEIYGV